MATEPIPSWKTWWRKWITIRTVSSGDSRGFFSQQEFIEHVSAVQRQAAASASLEEKTAAFWRMENLSAAFLKTAQPGNSLNDPSLPVEIRPICHCGMGVAAVEVGGFEARSISQVIDRFSNPQYRLFSYESIGAMLAVYEPDLFGLATRLLGSLGLVPLPSLRRPAPERFVAQFPPDIRRLIAHGYGRLTYFKSPTLKAALRRVTATGLFPHDPCLQGIAFAYAMVNTRDLYNVLETRPLADPAGRTAFRSGLIYALEFWEWMAPGFLDLVKPREDEPRALVEEARRQIERCRARGYLEPFWVGSDG